MTVSATTVTQYYTGIFRQAPSAAVSSAYQAMANDQAALNSMLGAANLQVDPVVRLYQTAFNRLPDPAGMTAWVVPFSTNQITLQQIANGFTQSTEFTNLYPATLSNAQYVGALYWNILQRQGEDAGIKGWTDALNSGALTRAQVLLGFSESAEFTKKVEPNVNIFLTNIAQTPVADQSSSTLYSGNLFDQNGGVPSETYTLTTNIDTVDVTKDGALITGTQTTFQAADTINGKGYSNLTLKLTDTGTSAWTVPAATVNGIQTIALQNANGTGAVTGTYEKATVSFQDVRAGETLTINGLTVTSSNAGASAADIATAFRTGTTTGNAVVSGAQAATWTVAAGNSVNSLVYTNATIGNQTNLVIGGTAQSGLLQTVSITNGTAVTTLNTVSFTLNGVTLTTGAITGANAGELKTAAANAIASTINAYVGSAIAKSDGVATVTVVSANPVNIGSFTPNQAGGAGVSGAFTNNGLAPSSYSFTVTGGTTAETGKTATFTYNGVALTTDAFATGVTAATNAQTIGTAIAAKINAYVGSTIASSTLGVVTIVNPNGAVVANVATNSTGASFGTFTTNATSQGYTAASPATAVTVEGVDPVLAQSYTDTLDASKFAGATKFASTNSSGAVTIQNMTTQTAEISGNGTAANGNLRAEFKDSATTANINVASGVRSASITITGNNVATTTVNSTGATNSLAASTAAVGLTMVGATLNVNATSALAFGAGISDAALTTIKVSGSAQNIASKTGTSFNEKVSVDLGTLDAAVKTVDASGLTAGGVYVKLNNGVVTSFKGGNGNDVVYAGNTTNSTASIDAGSGTGDKLIVGATNDISTNGSKYLNFEVLQNDGTASLNASKVAGITSVITSGVGGGFTSLTAGQAAAVSLIANQAATALTYSLADASGTSDVLGVTVSNDTATTVVNATNLAIGGFETFNLTVSTGGTAIFNADGTAKTAGTDYGSFAVGTASTDLKTVTVAGAYAARFDASANLTKLTVLDASANTAGTNLKIAGQTGALVVTGSGAADLIEVGSKGVGGTQTINAGAGNDKITGLWSDLVGIRSLSGGDGTDTLASSTTNEAAVVVSDNFFANTTSIEKFTFANTSADLTWAVGGYANALVTATGGTLDIAATALAANAAATIDASGLTGSNLLKLNLKITGSSGVVTITSSAAGADSITLTTVATQSGNLIVDGSANTSAGITVNASGVASGTGTGNVIKGGTGADTITMGTSGAFAITGGAGKDTITLGTGAETVYYTTAATSVGDAGINVDSIVNFGTSGADKIGLLQSATAGALLRGVTITSGTTTVATMPTAVVDSTSVNSLSDVYTAIAGNAFFGAGNFSGSAAAAAASQIIAKQINFANGAAAGNYLVVNDAIAGFQGGFDLVVKVGSATIAAGDFVFA